MFYISSSFGARYIVKRHLFFQTQIRVGDEDDSLDMPLVPRSDMRQQIIFTASILEVMRSSRLKV